MKSFYAVWALKAHGERAESENDETIRGNQPASVTPSTIGRSGRSGWLPYIISTGP